MVQGSLIRKALFIGLSMLGVLSAVIQPYIFTRTLEVLVLTVEGNLNPRSNRIASKQNLAHLGVSCI